MFTINAQAGVTVMVMATEPKRTVRDEVYRRVDEGVCLQCDKPALPGKRGLCGRHYWKWYGSRGGLTDQQKAEKDAKLIRDGKLLKSRQGQRLQEKEAS